ncbi:MAG: ABC transporter ATP-binding protein [Deltaproteobacteria bacterium]|nr:ABC transporter ATP-binding protein [Deltaproteobacteria bacterium]
MSSIIEVSKLTKVFRPATGIAHWLSTSPIQHEIRVFEGLDLDIRRGEIFVLLGPNGGGKTTLLKVLATLLRPDEGTVRIAGHDVVTEENKVREKIGWVHSDERSFCWRLSGRENLRFFGRLWNLTGKALERRIGELTNLLEMEDFLDHRFDAYSTGMRQRLAVARGLLGGAKILLLDEPTRGLDPEAARTLLQSLRFLTERSGATILMVTHRIGEVETVCDRIGILRRGGIEEIEPHERTGSGLGNIYTRITRKEAV